jgi:predicted DNA-binding ribbon-helix-helix protein
MNYESSATLRLSDEHYEKLSTIAKARDMSISKLLRKITLDFLSQSCDYDGLLAVCEHCGL